MPAAVVGPNQTGRNDVTDAAPPSAVAPTRASTGAHRPRSRRNAGWLHSCAATVPSALRRQCAVGVQPSSPASTGPGDTGTGAGAGPAGGTSDTGAAAAGDGAVASRHVADVGAGIGAGNSGFASAGLAASA